ncbi:hypothetical protein BDQ12DRAFT_693003 [Crucibulum laeve]|uniref:Uncharacterized protein n=1 Tax=Crucibulum laeve TaxID=68775 RepID=A0A5C3LTK6_9AGAR|nr:hypothetical protein BDQ12DRAFT_693003 [Crucibulum laeve]
MNASLRDFRQLEVCLLYFHEVLWSLFGRRRDHRRKSINSEAYLTGRLARSRLQEYILSGCLITLPCNSKQ